MKKQLEEMENVKPQMEEPIPEAVEVKQESQRQKEQEVPEELPQTEHISNPGQQERLGKFARLFGGRRKDLLDIALKQGLTPEQLEEVRKCLESGLTDLDIIRIIETKPAPEKMQKMREILLLVRTRKGGEHG